MRFYLPLLCVLSLLGCVAPTDDVNHGLGASFGEDGSLFTIGAATSDEVSGVWLSRVEPDGRRRWQTVFGTDEPEKATDVVAGSDQVTVVGSVTTLACDRRTVRGFVAEFDLEGHRRRTRQVRRSTNECDRGGLTVRRVAVVGDRLVALAADSGSRDDVTVFTFDETGIGRAAKIDGTFRARALLGHRNGFVVAGNGGELGVTLTAFAPDGEVRWHRAVDAESAVVASALVDGEVVLALRSPGDATVTLLRYALDDGTLLWSAGLRADGSPLAIVDGRRRRWAVVLRNVWDFTVVGWQTDEPEVAAAYTAEGVVNLAFRHGERGLEIADRGTENVVRWWCLQEGAACDRPAGLVRVPDVVAPTVELARADSPWVDAEVELVDWTVASQRRQGELPIRVCR